MIHLEQPSLNGSLVALGQYFSTQQGTLQFCIQLDFLAYISVAESIVVSSTTFTQSVPKATEFGEITLRLGLLRCSRSSKVPSLVPIESS